MAGLLNHSPGDILRYLLIAAGSGTLPTSNGSWPIHADKEPDTPDNCITIRTTEGVEQGRVQITGVRQGQFAAQVRVRSTGSPTGYQKAAGLQHTMNTTFLNEEITISGSNYIVHSAYCSDPISLGEDKPDSRRFLHTLNVMLNIRKTN